MKTQSPTLFERLYNRVTPFVNHPLRFQILTFTATRTVFNTMHRMVYPFLAVFGRGLGVDLAALSIALTTRSVAGTFGPLLASVADSRGRKIGMLFGTILFTVGLSIIAFWPSYLTFLVALILTTLGKYVFDPSMQAYIGDRTSYQRRGLVIAFTEMGWSLSFILGIPLMGFLIAREGWIAPFPLLALLGLATLALLTWQLPKDPVPAKDRPNIRENFGVILTYWPALLGLGVGLLMSSANEVVNLVFGVWMEDSFGLKIAALGAASAVIGFAELSGEILVGGLTDRMGKMRAVAGGLALNCLAALILPLLGRTLTGAFLGLFFFYITFEFTLVSSIPLMTEILPESRATLMSANVAAISLGRALGALCASPLYMLSDTPGIAASAIVAVLFNLLAIIVLRGLQISLKSESQLASRHLTN
jgi:predicted MFS family arabinose efflux permease